MKKVINSPEDIVTEMLQGFVKAHHNSVSFADTSKRVILSRQLRKKVGIVIGGGSGHEPLFMGYVGPGLADAAVVGNVFAAPTPDAILAAIKAVDCGEGVLCVFGNYAGDVLNFDMAKELAEMEGIKVANIVVCDDIASAKPEQKQDRRGIAGDVYMLKLLGAAAESGASFAACLQLSEKVSQNLFSIGIGLHPGTHPVNGEPGFYLAENEMEFGLGIHGEPGIEKRPIGSAKEISALLLNYILAELPTGHPKEVAYCINGLGSTTLLELYIVSNCVNELMTENGFVICDTLVGSFCTTQEMGGISLSLQLLDEQTKSLLKKKAVSPHFYKGV